MNNLTQILIRGLTFLAITLVSAGCASTAQTVSRSNIGASFDIHYGTVERVEQAQVESRAPQGAIMGGMIGGVTSNHHHRGEHALEGAVAGALLAALLDGNRNAFKYTVELSDGGITKIISETAAIAEGDCVSVELGKTANIRRVSSVHCEYARSPVYGTSREVEHKMQQDAGECHEAKQMALQATTAEATDIALKKVRVFCE